MPAITNRSIISLCWHHGIRFSVGEDGALKFEGNPATLGEAFRSVVRSRVEDGSLLQFVKENPSFVPDPVPQTVGRGERMEDPAPAALTAPPPQEPAAPPPAPPPQAAPAPDLGPKTIPWTGLAMKAVAPVKAHADGYDAIGQCWPCKRIYFDIERSELDPLFCHKCGNRLIGPGNPEEWKK